MARNKKYRTGQTAIRFGPAVKALVLCLLIGGSGIGYVAEQHEIYQLGQCCPPASDSDEDQARDQVTGDMEKQAEEDESQRSILIE